MSKLVAIVTREPAALVGALITWVAVANPSPAVMAAVTATGAWLTRMASSPKRSVDDAKQAGYNQAVADVSALNAPSP